MLAAIVFLMELMLRGTLLKPAKTSRKYEMEDSFSERGEKFKRMIRRRLSICSKSKMNVVFLRLTIFVEMRL